MSHESETKQCQNCKQDFTIEPEDFNFYEKIKVPPPTFCPECRYQRRLANRNEWNFYKRDCSLCGKDMVSIYNKDYPGPVYCQPCYWSDKWDTSDYGKDFDFSRPFFEQFKEHRFTVPRMALTNKGSINSEYTNQATDNKNCYLTIASSYNEYCFYGNWYQHSRECLDCWVVDECELLYECLDCLKCYKSAWLETAADCNECYFGKNLRGCSNCFGCVNLRSKSLCWFNEQLSKEEYQKRFESIEWSLEGIQKNKEKIQKLYLKLPVKYYHGVNTKDCSGDYIGFSKNTKNAFNCFKNENLKYSQDAWEAKDCMDLTETLDNTLDYESEGAGWGQNNISVSRKYTGSNVYYSELTFNSDNLFGCVSIIKKKYCIFNKQYSKEEYLILKEKIIEHMRKTGEWGEFFPISISPFSYNESVVQEYFPLTKEQILSKGYPWYDRPKRNYSMDCRTNELPKTIDLIDDSILDKTIQCKSQLSEEDIIKYTNCTTAFKITPDELILYKKIGVPIPEKCFACRRFDRLARRNPRKLWHRKCMKEGCKNEFETSYAPDRPEIVYCEKCYQQEVY